MTPPKLRSIFFAILLGIGSPHAGAETYYGVRNGKCAASADDAKAQIIERLGADRKLCDGAGGAAQVGGWSCRAGAGGCPKSKFRCNTQYRCARPVSSEGIPPATVPAPSPTTPTIAPTPSTLPATPMNTPSAGAMATVPTPNPTLNVPPKVPTP